MKKITSFLLILLCLFPLVTLTSCGETINKPIKKSDVQRILERRYGKDFTCVSEDLDKDETGNIIFEDEDGIQCQYNIIKITNEDELFRVNYKYTFSEDYAVNYYSAHPEFFEPLNDGIHKCEVNNNNIYTMYYDSFEDIDEVVDFTFNIINNIELVVKDNSNSDIMCCPPSIYFACNSSKYDISDSILYMPGSEKCNEYKHYQYISDTIKRGYVKTVKRHNDPEELSKLKNEQILLYDPINVITPIKYNGKTLLDRMHFEENDGSRKNKHRGYSYYTQIRASDNYDNNQLIRLLKKAGWDVESEKKPYISTVNHMSLTEESTSLLQMNNMNTIIQYYLQKKTSVTCSVSNFTLTS